MEGGEKAHLGAADDPLFVEAQVEDAHVVSDESHLLFPPPLARPRLADEVPDDDAAVGRARDEDLVVVLEAQD